MMKVKWIFAGLLITIFLFVTFLFARYEWYMHSINKAAENYVYYLTQGEYSKAFDYVGYFDEAVDKEPKLSYQGAKKIWMDRIKRMNNQDDVHIIGYSNLIVRDEDGYPMGSVDLTIKEHGKRANVYTSLGFIKRDGKWKVTNIGAREDDKNLNYNWENIIGGRITNE